MLSCKVHVFFVTWFLMCTKYLCILWQDWRACQALQLPISYLGLHTGLYTPYVMVIVPRVQHFSAFNLSGTVVGNTVGLARAGTAIAVRVLNDFGSGSYQ